MNFETIRLERDARGIATVTLARPDKHNAMNARMIAELDEAARDLGEDADVRAVVLAAEGRSFCAGGDLGWMREQAEKDRAGKMAEARALAAMLGAWNALPKPVIARVQGAAYGGGVGMIAVCDIAVAAGHARFGLTETRLGLIPATIGPFVVRKMGEAFARQVFFNARPFGTEFALRAGLIARAVADDGLDAAIEEEASAFLECAPGAVADAKALARRLGGQDPQELAEMTANALADRWETDEAQAGIAAFFSRQTPPWKAG
ncbi:crotonase/enoyl-CoA hydratase family protein [Oricola thermophila]|uniref:Crotonase/enoyl-CoA hydratase family protein n=1 Tax=Oricola thermophila TaxID=2742145 RepID=A0A6N1VCR5_9HYPH|nr:crotonase/enoyl-CoA hydratase family protein [Oricola thermophila]QKV17012.1 crotonase/enoyl-CoA hydratase family protein [Oricola thermophila]